MLPSAYAIYFDILRHFAAAALAAAMMLPAHCAPCCHYDMFFADDDGATALRR